MLAILTMLGGVLLAVTIVQNGDLALYMGNYHATVLVHIVGLVMVLLLVLVKREKIALDRATPWYGYFGGVLGVLTVLGCNLTFATLGVSVSVAMMLLGQTLMGVAVDQFGLFGAERRPFKPRHAFSFALIIAGVVIMLIA